MRRYYYIVDSHVGYNWTGYSYMFIQACHTRVARAQDAMLCKSDDHRRVSCNGHPSGTIH